ncbi:hypothetical protein KOW79_015171 [Hemibagrus wyckioides]|uniref:AIG1-type G domain-containing protein n=1 Tax=Hemibagrus wyckioides TaxID=337641 RepID=A0A9D3NCA3_9TELE|nr:hypothetical protein KOW79_015171 [Hemibagrus wyckioides]
MEDCGAEKDNTDQEPQPSGTRKRRGSKDFNHPTCTFQGDDDVCSLGSPSDEPKSELRLVLLGGDCADNNYTADIILRSDNKKEMRNPKKGNVRKGSVEGRQLSLFVTPSYWMNHLASYWIFSNGVESIRDEIQNCTSVTFPGPHAFLLVMRAGQTPGKEHLLLKAITHMFGAEALEYTMVLFIYGHEWENPKDALKNHCVKMCGTKYFMLENNDENVEELFRRLEAMTQRKQSRFFIQRSYENLMKVYFEPWERSQMYKEMQLKRELEELKIEQDELKTELHTLRQTERDLREELEASRHQVSALQELDTAKVSEKQLRKELEASRYQESALQKELDTAKGSEKQLRKELEASRYQEMTTNQNKPLDDL